VLKNTIANNTKKAISRQTAVLNKHINSLTVSGIRYAIGNIPTTIASKQI
jgi:hypothetical protein